MTLREIEQHRVKKILGDFCNRRIPKDQRGQTRLSYEIEGDEVILIQETVIGFDWIRVPIAKIQYSYELLSWRLYWSDSGSWKEYITGPTLNLQTLVDEIDTDPSGVFWGEERP
jgi:hypothetical protein